MTTAASPSRGKTESSTALGSLIRTLRRRDMVAGFLTALPVTLGCGGVIWAGTVALGRWTNHTIPTWEFAGLLGGLAVSAAAYYGWSRARSPLSLLLHADTVLKLPSVLSNALQLSADPAPFAQSAVQTGEDAAAGISSHARAQLVPLWRHSWWRSLLATGPLLASLGLAGWVWSTDIRPLGSEPLGTRLTVDDAQQLVTQAVEAIAPTTESNQAIAAPREDPIAARARAELDALEQELRSGTIKPDEAAARAARSLESAAESLDAQAKSQQAQADRAAEAMAQAAAPVANSKNGESADELTKALAQAEMAKAAARAEDLARQAGQLSESERFALAEELQAVADSMATAAPSSTSNQAEDESAGTGADRQSGIPDSQPEATANANPSNPADLAAALRHAAEELRKPTPAADSRRKGKDTRTQTSDSSPSPVDSDKERQSKTRTTDRSKSPTGNESAADTGTTSSTDAKPSSQGDTPDREQATSGQGKESTAQDRVESKSDSASTQASSDRRTQPGEKASGKQGAQDAPSRESKEPQSKDGSAGQDVAPRDDGSQSRHNGQGTPKQDSASDGNKPSSSGPAKNGTPSDATPAASSGREEAATPRSTVQGAQQAADSRTPDKSNSETTAAPRPSDTAAVSNQQKTAKNPEESQPEASRSSSPAQSGSQSPPSKEMGTQPQGNSDQGADTGKAPQRDHAQSKNNSQKSAAPASDPSSNSDNIRADQPQPSRTDHSDSTSARESPTASPRAGRTPDSSSPRSMEPRSSEPKSSAQRENSPSPQPQSSSPLGPPTSRPSDQSTEPRNRDQAPTEKPNALSELAQKFRSIDRARQGQPPESGTQRNSPQDLRKKAQDLLAQADARNKDSGTNQQPAGTSSSGGQTSAQTGQMPHGGNTSPGQLDHTSAGAGDPSSDGKSIVSAKRRNAGASQSIDFNPTAASKPTPTDSDRVIAELLGQPRSDGARSGHSSGSAAGGQASIDESLRSARKQADRAIESQMIPREYQDLVRRVFRRYESRGPAAASANSPDSTDPASSRLSPDAAPANSAPANPAPPK
jgi:hypothetical protein